MISFSREPRFLIPIKTIEDVETVDTILGIDIKVISYMDIIRIIFYLIGLLRRKNKGLVKDIAFIVKHTKNP